jgi:multicomponent Na+:H+ antiporter subunit G
VAFYHPGWTLKLLILIFFVLMTVPVSSHALARAAFRIGIPMAPQTKVHAEPRGEA